MTTTKTVAAIAIAEADEAAEHERRVAKARALGEWARQYAAKQKATTKMLRNAQPVRTYSPAQPDPYEPNRAFCRPPVSDEPAAQQIKPSVELWHEWNVRAYRYGVYSPLNAKRTGAAFQPSARGINNDQ